ncbi:MAG: hypothetical protein ACREBE_17915 [bacterium]
MTYRSSIIRFFVRFAVLGLACAVAIGCARPTYTYDPRPPVSPAAEPGRACYQEQRLELAAGRVFWARHQPYTPNLMISTYYTDGGLALYRGGQRFDARGALKQIGEAGLSRDYEAILSLTERDYRMYPVYRNTAVALGAVGTAAIAVGSIWLVSEAGKDDSSNAPAYVMIGGLVAGGLSLIPALLAYRSIDGNIQHERYLALFSDEKFAPKLVDGARRHNQRVARQCGVAEATLPMTPNARDAVHEH